jgi:hypothetical protein
MTPSEVRVELLEQHAELRRMVERARLRAERVNQDGPTLPERLSEIRLLADAVKRHNQREEQLLREVLRTVDAWGQIRAEVMNDDHVREHAELYQALLALRFATDDTDQVLDTILAHMAHEEQAFLNDVVLRDDFVVVDPFSG